MTASSDNLTRRQRAKDLVLGYLRTYCVGAARRRPAREIAGGCEIDPPLDNRDVHRAIQDLRAVGELVASEDAGRSPGVWLATEPEDMDLTIYRMNARAMGEIATLNRLVSARAARWPIAQFPPKSELQLRPGGETARLPRQYKPADRDARARAVPRHIGREARRLEAGGAPAAPTAVYEYVCIGCGEEVVTAIPPNLWPSHRAGCREPLLLLPRDADEARRWAEPIRRMTNVRREREAEKASSSYVGAQHAAPGCREEVTA